MRASVTALKVLPVPISVVTTATPLGERLSSPSAPTLKPVSPLLSKTSPKKTICHAPANLEPSSPYKSARSL